MNRGDRREAIFHDHQDRRHFLETLAQACAKTGWQIHAWCLMPNHWHLVLWPRNDGDLSEFMRWLTVTHTQRWHAAHRTAGTGPLYRGRFKSFPIQADEHLLSVTRYVERNALRAKLVEQADAWRWSSLWRRVHGDEEQLLDAGPVPLPRGWRRYVQQAETEAELTAVRKSVVRGMPFGASRWQRRTAERLDLLSTLRPRGRPRISPPR